MHGQEAHNYVREVLPALVMVVMIDVYFDLWWEIYVCNFALIVFYCLYDDDLVRAYVLYLNRLGVFVNFCNQVYLIYVLAHG